MLSPMNVLRSTEAPEEGGFAVHPCYTGETKPQ